MYGLEFRSRSRTTGSTLTDIIEATADAITPIVDLPGIEIPESTIETTSYDLDFRSRDRLTGSPAMVTSVLESFRFNEDGTRQVFETPAPYGHDFRSRNRLSGSTEMVTQVLSSFKEDWTPPILPKPTLVTGNGIPTAVVEAAELPDDIVSTMIWTDSSSPTLETSTTIGASMLPVPLAVMALATSAKVINLSSRSAPGLGGFFGGLTGSGKVQAVLGLMGVAQIVDLIGLDFFSGPDLGREEEFEKQVQEIVDSGYILWDETDRRGNPREMEYLVVPINGNERPYGMAYRPFSISSMRKRDNNQDTYRRPRRAPRRTRR